MDDSTETLRMENGPAARRTSGAWARRRAAEVAGVILLVLGVAALFLPGPGMLTIVAGLALLSTSCAWADKLMHPIRAKAFHLASEGVRTWPRIVVSFLSGLVMVGVGIAWGQRVPAPGWWPIAERWWQFGGWATGISIMASGTFAMGLIVYSVRQFRTSSMKRVPSVIPRIHSEH